jgi:hypothetical protein
MIARGGVAPADSSSLFILDTFYGDAFEVPLKSIDVSNLDMSGATRYMCKNVFLPCKRHPQRGSNPSSGLNP